MRLRLQGFVVAALTAATMFCGTLSAQDTPAVTGSSEPTVYVKIEQAPDLEGTLMDLAEVQLETSFGMVPVPVEKIDGIKMNAESDGTAVVAFKNGDMLTGIASVGVVKLKTDWGVAHIDATAVDSLTMSEDGRFFRDNSGGTSAWRYSKVTAEAAAPARSPQPARTPIQPGFQQPVRGFGG